MTLVELLVGLAIASLVAVMAIASIYQVMMASAQANDTQLAISQVRAAEHWMTRDLLTTQGVTPGVDNGFPLELIWTDHLGQNHMVVYSLVAMPTGSLYDLRRVYTAPDLSTSELAVASYIDPLQSSCATVGTSIVQVTVTATSGEYSETRVFDVTRRVA